MRGARAHSLFAALALLAALASHARAQVTVSAAVDSDYRFRGLTLSGGQPDLRLNLSYDHKSGVYAGLSVVGARKYDGTAGLVSDIEYVGFVSPRLRGMAWEAGLTHTHIREHVVYDYSEVYGGVLSDHFSARLSWSPRYYGRRMSTVYADLNAGQRLSTHWRVFGHAGALTPLTGLQRKGRYDVRAGVAASLRNYELQLAWTKSNPVVVYPGRTVYSGEAVVVTATCYF